MQRGARRIARLGRATKWFSSLKRLADAPWSSLSAVERDALQQLGVDESTWRLGPQSFQGGWLSCLFFGQM